MGNWRALFLEFIVASRSEPLRLALFIDAQNAYRGARASFFPHGGAASNGQFDPVRLGQLLAARGGPGGRNCVLTEARVYTGRPDSRLDHKTYAAHMKQCARWEADGATVIWRPLRYPPRRTGLPPQEKGIDVALCIDFVTMAIDGAFDIGIIMSTDTDLLPALEFTRNRYPATRYPAVAAWNGRRRLSLPNGNLWCHWLSENDYRTVADDTNYNR